VPDDDKDKPKGTGSDEARSDEVHGSSDKKEPAAKADEAAAGEEPDEAGGPDDDEADDEDAARVDVLAKRVEKLGGEDEADRIAREEEQKLAERRARLKKKKGKKGGLDAAASKKLAKIGERAMPKSTVATAVDAGDPLLNRTAELSKWLKKNSKQVQYVVVAAVVAVAGAAGYMYYQQNREEQASALLDGAVSDERGTIGDPDKDDDDRPKPPYPVFKTAEDRRESALKKYRDVQSKYPGSGAAYLARLAEGSVLLDKREADAAASAFRDVIASPLAQTDHDVKGRALEGLGFAFELKPSPDEALKTFKELENVDVKGFKELGMYHQARILEAKGEKDPAKELLKTLLERINKPGDKPGEHPFPYLQEVAEDRLRTLDPSAVPPRPQMGGMGGMGGHGGGAGGMTEQQMKELIEKLKKQAEQGGK
jgi:hypothetical protein